MAIIAHFSTHGAPGVTMSTLALALQWPRPVMLVEADTASPSSILAGFMRGRVVYERNMTQLANNMKKFGQTSKTVFDQMIPLAQDPARFAEDKQYRKHLLPAFPSPRAATGHKAFWRDLLIATRAFEKATGYDIFFDMGRITTRETERMALVTNADLAVAHLSATFIDTWAAQENIERIYQLMDEQGHPEGLCSVFHQSPAVNFPAGELASLIPSAPLLTTLPHSPEAAAIFSHGADIPTSAKKLDKKLRAYRTAVSTYSSKLQVRLKNEADYLNPSR